MSRLRTSTEQPKADLSSAMGDNIPKSKDDSYTDTGTDSHEQTISTKNNKYNKTADMNTGESFGDWLISVDVRLTSALAVCANKDSTLGFLRPVMKFLEFSCHGVPWILGNIIALFISHDTVVQEKLINLLGALLLDLLIVGVVKIAVRRQRPAHNDMDMFGTMAVDMFSFPSGHTTRAAAVAWLIIAHLSPGGLWDTALVVWAVIVAVSRVMLGRHHVLDVVCGLAIGLLQYQLLVHILWLPPEMCQRFLRPFQEELHL